MYIAICDDEQMTVLDTEKQIKQWAKARKVSVSISKFSSAEEFLFHWSDAPICDLVILDIKMKKMTGMELARLIRKTDSELQIVFISGLKDFAIDGYDVSALSFLIKPYSSEQFFSTLDRAYAIYDKKEQSSLLVTQEKHIIKIPYYEIVYIEVHGHYCDIFTQSMGCIKTKKSVRDMLSLLDASFFVQCHRSYIVNIRQIVTLSRQNVTFRSNISVPVSSSKIQLVTSQFMKYHNSVRTQGIT